MHETMDLKLYEFHTHHSCMSYWYTWLGFVHSFLCDSMPLWLIGMHGKIVGHGDNLTIYFPIILGY